MVKHRRLDTAQQPRTSRGVPAEIQAPALVVMGTAHPDFQDPEAEAAWIVEHLTDAEQILVPSAGQDPQTEDPETVNPALVAFVQKVLHRP